MIALLLSGWWRCWCKIRRTTRCYTYASSLKLQLDNSRYLYIDKEYIYNLSVYVYVYAYPTDPGT